MRLFIDTGSLADIEKYAGKADGFTTNCILMQRCGVTNYRQFVKDAVRLAGGKEISIPLLADVHGVDVRRQAEWMASLGENVFCKVLSHGLPRDVVTCLFDAQVNVNVTGIVEACGPRSVSEWHSVSKSSVVFSVLAGRIADWGSNPVDMVNEWAMSCALSSKSTVRGWSSRRVLWASTRSVGDFFAAERAQADIITAKPDLYDAFVGGAYTSNRRHVSAMTAKEFIDAAGHYNFDEEAIAEV